MAQPILTLNERIQATSLEAIITTLSLAVSLHDDFSAKIRPPGKIKVSLKELEQQALQNLSGYYFFTDVEDGTYTIQVTSDYYFDEEEEVILSNLDSQNPVVDITLKPLPFYPFPPGTTLIKGVVKNSAGEAVPDATVRVLNPTIETQTTEKGEFVFYFTGLTEDDIIRVNGKRYVKSNGDQALTLEVTYGAQSQQVQTEVEESKTNGILITI